MPDDGPMVKIKQVHRSRRRRFYRGDDESSTETTRKNNTCPGGGDNVKLRERPRRPKRFAIMIIAGHHLASTTAVNVLYFTSPTATIPANKYPNKTRDHTLSMSVVIIHCEMHRDRRNEESARNARPRRGHKLGKTHLAVMI